MFKSLNQKRIKYNEDFRVDDHNFFIQSQVAGELQYSIDGITFEKCDDLSAGLTPIRNCPVHAVYKVTTSATFTPQSPLSSVTWTIPELTTHDPLDPLGEGHLFTFVPPVPGESAKPQPAFINNIANATEKAKWVAMWTSYATYSDELIMCN